jgi:hypothetical protein
MSSSPKEFTSQSMTPEALPPHPLSSWLSKKEKSGPNSDHVCACASGLCQRKGSDGHLMVWEEDLFLNTLKNSKDESLRTWCALPVFFLKNACAAAAWFGRSCAWWSALCCLQFSEARCMRLPSCLGSQNCTLFQKGRCVRCMRWECPEKHFSWVHERLSRLSRATNIEKRP